MLMLVYAVVCGTYFSFLQFSYFFVLESTISSASLTYLTTITAWITGAVAGLSARQQCSVKLEALWTVMALGAFYLLSLVAALFPFDNRFLILYAALVMVSGSYSGYFFNRSKSSYGNIKALFYWENNGFILGMILSFMGMSFFGLIFLYIFTGLCCLTILALQYQINRRQTNELHCAAYLSRFTKTI